MEKLGKILPFGRPGATQVNLSPLHQIEAYWDALPKQGLVPTRASVDPRGLENVLEFAFVLERIAPGVARFRVAGQNMARLTGMEVRGMPVSALFNAPSRPQIGLALEHIFDAPAIAQLTIETETRFARSSQRGQMVLLPLCDDKGVVNRALGGLMLNHNSAEPAPRLVMTGHRFAPLGDSPREPACPPQPVRQFAEAQAPFTGAPPHLRLVKTDS